MSDDIYTFKGFKLIINKYIEKVRLMFETQTVTCVFSPDVHIEKIELNVIMFLITHVLFVLYIINLTVIRQIT